MIDGNYGFMMITAMRVREVPQMYQQQNSLLIGHLSHSIRVSERGHFVSDYNHCDTSSRLYILPMCVDYNE